MAEQDNSENKGSQSKSPTWIIILLFLTGALVLGYFFVKPKNSEEPPPPMEPPQVFSGEQRAFFDGYLNAVEKIGEARKFFSQGQSLYQNPNSPTPESQPETQEDPPSPETAPSNGSPLLQATEKYSLALEYFKTAGQILEKVEFSQMKPEVETCQNKLQLSLENYIGSSTMFLDLAKKRYAGEQTPEETVNLSEAKAKFVVAEDLLKEGLVDGCGNKIYEYWIKYSQGDGKGRASRTFEMLYSDQPDILSQLKGKLAQIIQ